ERLSGRPASSMPATKELWLLLGSRRHRRVRRRRGRRRGIGDGDEGWIRGGFETGRRAGEIDDGDFAGGLGAILGDKHRALLFFDQRAVTFETDANRLGELFAKFGIGDAFGVAG